MKKHFIIIFVLAGILAFVDQITKIVAFEEFQTPLPIIKSFFRLSYAENTGIAFSIPIPYMILIIVNVLLLILIIFFTVKELKTEKSLTKISIALLLGGGIGNLIDRLFRGYVIDFISIWKYPSFNFADIYVTLGVILLLIFYKKIKLQRSA